jgi:hypothetical protein
LRGDAWFGPIETGIRERVRGFVEPSRAKGCAISLSSPDIEKLIGHELDAALRRDALRPVFQRFPDLQEAVLSRVEQHHQSAGGMQ